MSIAKHSKQGHDKTGAHASTGASEVGPGKHTLTESLTASAASAGPRAQASSSDAEIEIEKQMDLAGTAWGHITDEREHALFKLNEILQKHNEHAPSNLLAELAKLALDEATAHIGGVIVSKVADKAKHTLEDKVFRRVEHETHVRVQQTNGKAGAFVDMQLEALDDIKHNGANHLISVGADLKKKVNHHPDQKHEFVERAKSIHHAFANHQHIRESYQHQYNISLAKWFAALSQSSFGANPNRKDASDLSAKHLATNPLSGAYSNFTAPEYKHKQGFVHLELLLGFTGAVKVTRFATPGIDHAAWGFARDRTEAKGLGELALNDLPQHIHLPVIADVRFNMNPTDREVRKHFPGGETGQHIQPIAISWNEKGIVAVELPTQAGDYAIPHDARTFLGQKFADATRQGDYRAAGKWLIETKIGNHSLALLNGLNGTDKPVP